MPEFSISRDPQRTPMQWDGSKNAGFTSGKPWLHIAKTFKELNVEVQKQDQHSMLCLFQRLIELRRTEPALHIGTYAPVPAEGISMCTSGSPKKNDS
jgi:alpha-glucosidase